MSAPIDPNENAVIALARSVGEVFAEDPRLRMEREAHRTVDSLKRLLEDAEANPAALVASYEEVMRVLGDGCSIMGELTRIAVRHTPGLPAFIII